MSFVDRVEFADPSKSILSTSQDKFTRMSSAPFTYGNALNQIVMMGLDNLHNQDYTGDGVHVAVMDSGFPNVDSMSGFSQLSKNETPTYEVISGAAIAFAAILLILPGFATDFLGFLLIFPLTRKLIFGNLSNKFKKQETKKNNYIDGEYEDIEDNDDRKI